MSKQQDTLPYLIQRCCEVDPNCGVQLQGSVARGVEREDSDIDLCIVIDPSGRELRFNEFLNDANHGAQIRVVAEPTGVNVDINWIYVPDLIEISQSSLAIWWHMFAFGRPIHDPLGIAKRCQDHLRAWYDKHPGIVQEWDKQQVEWDRRKIDPAYKLEFPTQYEFCRHLTSIYRKNEELTSAGNTPGNASEK